jgi:hypothetical protein
MPDDGLGRAITTIRAGLALGAVAALLVALSPLFDLVDGPARSPEGATFTTGVGASVAAVAVVAGLAIAASLVWRLLWLHLLGIVLATATALVSALLVIAARTSDDFAEGADLSLQTGAVLLIAAFWLALVGVGVALVGVRMVAVAAPPPVIPPSRAGQIVKARTAPISAILGVAAVVVVVTAGAAAAYGVLALGDIRSSNGRLTGRGMALTGLVLGILVLSLLAAVGGVGTLVASPG